MMLHLWVFVFSFRKLANAYYVFQLLVGTYIYKIIQLNARLALYIIYLTLFTYLHLVSVTYD